MALAAHLPPPKTILSPDRQDATPRRTGLWKAALSQEDRREADRREEVPRQEDRREADLREAVRREEVPRLADLRAPTEPRADRAAP
jgi:hypothetical protein